MEPTREAERKELLRQATGGDRDALQRLIVYYHDALRARVAARLGAKFRRHIDPEDVLQEAYAAAYTDIAGVSFDGPAGFYKWLERVALDRLAGVQRDLQRKKRDILRTVHADTARRRAGDARTSYDGLLGSLRASIDTPSRQLAAREASAAVISSLARLTGDQRTVIRMRFIEDRPPAEIAAAVGKTEAAVYMLCARGLKALAGVLGPISGYVSRM
jgi:RNA polymerase sigma-70 factor (subfamily 1)